jgi:aspartyl protease family protein
MLPLSACRSVRARLLAACLSLLAGAAQAADISVLGLFTGKALLVVDGGAPRTYAVDDKIAGAATLVEVDRNGATIEEGGRRSTVALGQYVGTSAGAPGKVTLSAGEGGHFIANGQINGGSVRMIIDTGATYIALPAADARRLGIDYRKGRVVPVNTANGTVPAYLVRLDSVRVGELELFQIDALVQEGGLSVILLGNSFLNRCELQRNAGQMTLTRRF